jgi:hypothetical protein
MRRSEKLILVRDLPASIVNALDSIMQDQAFERVALRAITEDFSPLLSEPGGPVVFVLSPPRDEWVACFSSLSPDAESEIAVQLAAALEQPVIYVLLDGDSGRNLYRFFDNGDLHEEALPDDETTLDEVALLDKLVAHGIDAALIDDRTTGFGAEHFVVGYSVYH